MRRARFRTPPAETSRARNKPILKARSHAILGAHVHLIFTLMNEVSDNGIALRELIEHAEMTQADALMAVNRNQAFPIALSTWKAYLAAPSSARRRICPNNVLEHARKTIKKSAKSHGLSAHVHS